MEVDSMPAHTPPALAEPDRASRLRATEVAGRVGHWGFLANPDLPDGPGPAYVLVALRPIPTLQHFDPEAVDYWVTVDGRGQRRTLTHDTSMPRSETFSWGLIRLVDRLDISNEYLTFGGHLDAARIEDDVVAAFSSPAPLLRRGGHSQGWDGGADAIGGFFGRMLIAIDYVPGFEAAFSEASPMTRYAAFIRDAARRRRGSRCAALTDDEVARIVRREATRLRAPAMPEWDAAATLLAGAIVD
jgi:hypothetical protein